MGLLGRIASSIGIEKIDTEPQKVVPHQKPAREPGQGLVGKTLGAVGVKAEALPSAADAEAIARRQTMVLAWQYLRHMIDKGVKEFYSTGSSPLLEQFVERPTLDALKNYLTDLRSQNIYWEFPKRRAASAQQITVIEEQLDAKKNPMQFTVQERFRDSSFFQLVELGPGNETHVVDARVGEGTERAILATVKVISDSAFQLISLSRADHVVI
jgi:hypothetical protein